MAAGDVPENLTRYSEATMKMVSDMNSIIQSSLYHIQDYVSWEKSILTLHALISEELDLKDIFGMYDFFDASSGLLQDFKTSLAQNILPLEVLETPEPIDEMQADTSDAQEMAATKPEPAPSDLSIFSDDWIEVSNQRRKTRKQKGQHSISLPTKT